MKYLEQIFWTCNECIRDKFLLRKRETNVVCYYREQILKERSLGTTQFYTVFDRIERITYVNYIAHPMNMCANVQICTNITHIMWYMGTKSYNFLPFRNVFRIKKVCHYCFILILLLSMFVIYIGRKNCVQTSKSVCTYMSVWCVICV